MWQREEEKEKTKKNKKKITSFTSGNPTLCADYCFCDLDSVAQTEIHNRNLTTSLKVVLDSPVPD